MQLDPLQHIQSVQWGNVQRLEKANALIMRTGQTLAFPEGPLKKELLAVLQKELVEWTADEYSKPLHLMLTLG